MRQTDTIGTVEAAELLGWSTTKVKMRVQEGSLPTLGKMRGQTGAYLFSRAVISQLAEERSAA